MDYVKYLSHTLYKKIPVYGKKEASIGIIKKKSIKKGDVCNTFRFSMENHWGTHIDAPAHFFDKANKTSDYPAKAWIFDRPCVIELSLTMKKIITVPDLITKIRRTHNIVLLKTGFGSMRGSKIYSCDGPKVSPAVGLWFRKERPNVRALGFDFISLGSFQDRALAREAHRAFLDPQSFGKPVLIIEDMNLNCNLRCLKMVVALPFLLDSLDSAPCTALGIFNKNQ